MQLALIKKTVWICCVYTFQILVRGFFSVHRASPSTAGLFVASIGNAWCKIEKKTRTKLPHFFYMWVHRLIDFALLAGTGNRLKSKTTTKLKRETNLDRHGPRPITPTFVIFLVPFLSHCRLTRLTQAYCFSTEACLFGGFLPEKDLANFLQWSVAGFSSLRFRSFCD